MFILFISIFSKSLLSFGYFIFAMMLIYNYRRFLEDPNAPQNQLYVLSWVELYLILDISLVLVYNIPITI